ncbi:MAG: hypothetical protein HUJ26_13525 [Planctomycetaceae bacterium]|nr:hypothetical protein [Planctomycetaceae bacterium]
MLNSELQFWYEECWHRTKTAKACRDVWEIHFSRQDQDALGGDFEVALKLHKTAPRMWMAAKSLQHEHVAVVQLALEMELVPQKRAEKLLKAMNADSSNLDIERPIWDRQRGILTYRGKCVREVRIFSKPSNVQTILDAFETANWVEFIEAPPNFDSDTVRETLRSLKEKLSLITFEQRSSGTMIGWREV